VPAALAPDDEFSYGGKFISSNISLVIDSLTLPSRPPPASPGPGKSLAVIARHPVNHRQASPPGHRQEVGTSPGARRLPNPDKCFALMAVYRQYTGRYGFVNQPPQARRPAKAEVPRQHRRQKTC
jgi:hypothetical protein